MAGVAEKARFYLERSVPQLREWQEKGIFSKADEIRTIVQKRNEFEFKALSPGNKPCTWSAYAKWEQSLEALRGKRCNRLKIRHLSSAHTGQGRVLAIYDRAVNRHPASSELWRECLGYTASVKATKRWRKTMTSALRMKPTDPELWIMAGRRSASVGDMAAARSFFMRGCRFCTKDCRLWIEYARCEMEWLARIGKHKDKLEKDPLQYDQAEGDDELLIDDSDDEQDEKTGGIRLPEPPRCQTNVIDERTSTQLKANPAMDGAIPMAIFDILQRQPFFKPEVAESFFLMLAAFRHVSVQSRVSQHVLDTLDVRFPTDPSTCNCYIQQPILGVSPYTAEFPQNLRRVLSRLEEKMKSTTDRRSLERKTVKWINQYLALEDLDEGVRKVLEHVEKKLAVQ